jgi:hypothetical protein
MSQLIDGDGALVGETWGKLAVTYILVPRLAVVLNLRRGQMLRWC